MMTELWQRYDELGRPLQGVGVTKEEATGRAELHAASHIWLWRRRSNSIEILLQKRASSKRTWPDKLDISAAGHVDLGEAPLDAALREMKEELGVTLAADELRLIGVFRAYIAVGGTGLVENEFQWVYLAEAGNEAYRLQAEEVGSLVWKGMDELRQELDDPARSGAYVPHGPAYFAMLFEGIGLIDGT